MKEGNVLSPLTPSCVAATCSLWLSSHHPLVLARFDTDPRCGNSSQFSYPFISGPCRRPQAAKMPWLWFSLSPEVLGQVSSSLV